jgi:DNA-directed RNA polymerase subunit M/transcription elongation factor TFIIS
MIQFCPVCKKLLEIKTENERNIFICNCGFKRILGVELSSVEISANISKGEGIITENNLSEGITHICKKCGNNQAEIISVGAKIAEEANLCIFRCLKCNHRERESDGTCRL